MMSKGNAPSAAQKRWRQSVVEYGCVVTGSPIVQVHHCLGATAKHNKVHIGHWFILPLSPALHDISSNAPDNITTNKKAFVEAHGTEKNLFLNMAYRMFEDGYVVPNEEVLNAIEGYHK